MKKSSCKVYALSTARAGSKTVPGKNILPIKGKPLYLHNILESLQTSEIIDTYITTDIPQVITNADKYGYQVIKRPDELCQDHSTHTDTIRHALLEIETRIEDKVDILVVMLGNTMNMDSKIVAKALKILEREPEVDSVITVIQGNHFNPTRAYIDDGSGKSQLTTFLSQEEIIRRTQNISLADKNSMGTILFQNGLWIIRREVILDADGLEPFPWFGSKIRYLEQPGHLQEIDAHYQIRLLV